MCHLSDTLSTRQQSVHSPAQFYTNFGADNTHELQRRMEDGVLGVEELVSVLSAQSSGSRDFSNSAPAILCSTKTQSTSTTSLGPSESGLHRSMCK